MGGSRKNEFVREQSDALLLRTGRFIWQMHMLSALLVTWLLWGQHSNAHLFAWAGWMIALAVAQGLICFRGAEEVSNAQDRASRLAILARLFDVTAIMLALGWAWLLLALTPADDVRLQGFMGFLAGGALLTGTGTHNLHYRMLAATLVIILGAMIWRSVIDEVGGQGQLAGMMLAIFGGLMLALGWTLRMFTRRGFALQWDKIELVRQLEHQRRELESARAEADAANDAKSRFLAQASHDLRQPIHSMGLFLASLIKEPLSPKASEIARRLDQSVGNLSQLFGSLLDVTMLDTRQTLSAPEGFYVGDLVEQVMEEFRPLAESEGLTLIAAADGAAIYADRIVVWRILQNLVSNAIRHGAGGKVRIVAIAAGDGVTLEVRDWGRGIAAADQTRIFTEFETSLQGGIGLGLAIVKRLASLSGVSVSLESTEGAGAAFRVGPFPYADVVGSHEQRDADELRDASGTAWVIDDDGPTLEATRDLLERWGWEVEAMTSPPLNLADFEAPDLIISDYELGLDRSGVAVIVELRARFGAIPAIVISGNSSPETRENVLGHGLVLLHKPVRPVQLRSAILGVCG